MSDREAPVVLELEDLVEAGSLADKNLAAVHFEGWSHPDLTAWHADESCIYANAAGQKPRRGRWTVAASPPACMACVPSKVAAVLNQSGILHRLALDLESPNPPASAVGKALLVKGREPFMEEALAGRAAGLCVPPHPTVRSDVLVPMFVALQWWSPLVPQSLPWDFVMPLLEEPVAVGHTADGRASWIVGLGVACGDSKRSSPHSTEGASSRARSVINRFAPSAAYELCWMADVDGTLPDRWAGAAELAMSLWLSGEQLQECLVAACALMESPDR